jgi:hypothetical protein
MYLKKDFFTLQKKIAIRPIENKGVQGKISHGLALIAQKTDLIEAETLFDADLGGEGVILKKSKIALRGDAASASWNKEILTHEGQSFVLVPYEEVLMVKEPEDSSESGT